MRVGLVVGRFDPRRGGLEQWTSQFADRLIEQGHEVHVVAAGFADEVRSGPIITHRIEARGHRREFGKKAEETLRSLRLDVIHDMGLGWFCDVFHPHGGSWISARKRSNFSYPLWMRFVKATVERLRSRRNGSLALTQRQFANRGQTVLALARFIVDDLQRLHGFSPEQIRLVYNGVDTKRFSPQNRATLREPLRHRLGIRDDIMVALIVAHNFRLKGVPTVLRAMRELTRAGLPVHTLVVGGKSLGGWRHAASRLGVRKTVTFVGSTDDTTPYYAAADVFVHPTYYDPCSLVLLEAAASGLPIITTNRFNGVSELLCDGTDSLSLSDPNDAAELARHMRVLLDHSTRQRMGHAARQMALKHPFERNTEEILSVYEEIVGSPRRAVGQRRTFDAPIPIGDASARANENDIVRRRATAVEYATPMTPHGGLDLARASCTEAPPTMADTILYTRAKEQVRYWLSRIWRDRPALLIFFFHAVVEDPDELNRRLVDPRLCTTLQELRGFIQYYQAQNYRFVAPTDVLAGLPPDGNYVLVTFDDGYYNNQLALPVLRELQVPAAFCISTGYVRSGKAYWWDVLYRTRARRGTPYQQIVTEMEDVKSLPWRGIDRYLIREFGAAALDPTCDADRPFNSDELAEFGRHPLVHLGNHTRDHTILTNLSAHEAHQQIAFGQEDLREMCGIEPPLIAYPNGSHSTAVRQAAAAAGLVLGVTVEKRKNYLPLGRDGRQPLSLGRFPLYRGRPLVQQLEIYRGDVGRHARRSQHAQMRKAA
jgi:glycosyltransferase involved in cell wall biosynthesis/peptidoglycan/xylan/chitin deacetylase (PgdA/CDA1 family)